MKPSITKIEKILKTRILLQRISHISYSFSKLNQQYPIDTLTEEQADEIIKAYDNLLDDARKITNDYLHRTKE